MKVCPKCGETKPLEAFGVADRATGRPQGWCRPCRSAATSARYRALPSKEAWARWTAPRLLARARKKGMLFGLTWRGLLSVAPDRCPALDVPLVYARGVQGSGAWDYSPSVDRIDNAAGYLPDNVVVVSKLANAIKTNADPEQIARVAAFYLGLRRHRSTEGTT